MRFNQGLIRWSCTVAAVLTLAAAPVGGAVAQNANANPNAGANANKGGNSANVSQAAFHANGQAPGLTGEANIHALAAGLNSIVRNYHGLLNGKDPKMDGIREFVLASVDCELNCAELEAGADAALAGLAAPTPYDGYAYGSPMTIAELIARYEALNDPGLIVDPADQAAYDTEIAEIEALLSDPAVAAYLDALLAASDIALRQALIDGASPSRTYDDQTLDELVAWASGVLGVGDAEGTIDDIVASLD